MKPFNILITLAAVVILGGFIFFKDGFKTAQSNPSTSIASKELVDRVRYLNYSEGNQELSQQYGKTVLFFAATTWCQTCSELDKEINKRISEIPSGVTILKVDYDNNREMKAKYGVTQQHTLVVVDKNGHEAKRWIGGNLDLLLQEVKDI